MSRLTAFGSDAERLVETMVPTHVLKLQNLKWQPIETPFKGACTCDVEFRAQRETTVLLGDSLQISPAEAEPVAVAEIPTDLPMYVCFIVFFINLQDYDR